MHSFLHRTIGRPDPAEVVALLPQLFASPAVVLQELADRHGPTVHLEVGPIQVLVVTEPEGVREVLVEQQHHLAKGAAVRSTSMLLGDGLLTSEGATHARRRRLVSPAFHRPQLAGYATTMGRIAREEVSGWADHTTLELHALMSRITLRIVGETLFGIDVTGDAARVGAALDGVLQLSNRLLPVAQLLGQGLTPDEQVTADALITMLDEVVAGIITERRAAPGERDIVSLLAAARDEDGSGLTDREIRNEAMTLFLAGHETTANALAWTLQLLTEHPELAAQLAAEAQRCGDGPVGIECADRLPLHRAALDEAIRLYPPAWLTSREVIESVTICGVELPVGAQVIVSPWLTQRDARWWPEPTEFRVDRWLYPDADRPKWAYFPFGGGSRACIGEHFAMLEATIILAEVVRHWRLAPAGPAPVPEFRVTLRPSPAVPVRVQPR